MEFDLPKTAGIFVVLFAIIAIGTFMSPDGRLDGRDGARRPAGVRPRHPVRRRPARRVPRHATLRGQLDIRTARFYSAHSVGDHSRRSIGSLDEKHPTEDEPTADHEHGSGRLTEHPSTAHHVQRRAVISIRPSHSCDSTWRRSRSRHHSADTHCGRSHGSPRMGLIHESPRSAERPVHPAAGADSGRRRTRRCTAGRAGSSIPVRTAPVWSRTQSFFGATHLWARSRYHRRTRGSDIDSIEFVLLPTPARP